VVLRMVEAVAVPASQSKNASMASVRRWRWAGGGAAGFATPPAGIRGGAWFHPFVVCHVMAVARPARSRVMVQQVWGSPAALRCVPEEAGEALAACRPRTGRGHQALARGETPNIRTTPAAW